MLTVEVDFLAGRYSATKYDDRNAVEWPPHPARLFSALVATWAYEEPPDQGERRALEWLEAQGSPSISASEVCLRAVTTHYVPSNDTAVLRSLQQTYDRLSRPKRLSGRGRRMRRCRRAARSRSSNCV